MNKIEDIFKHPIKKDNGFYIGTKSKDCKIDFCNEEKICKERNKVNNMKVFSLFLAAIILLLGASGCINKHEYKEVIENVKNYVGENAQSTAETVKNKLSLKYGCDFEVAKVGGRIDTSSTTFYLYPDFDSSMVFKTVIDSKTEEISDDFISRIIATKINSELKDNLNKYGISGEASAIFIKQDDRDEDDINITKEEYFEKYEVSSVFFYLVLNSQTLNDSSAENLISVCNSLGSKYNIQVAINGVTVSSKYSECAEQMKSEPDVSATWFDAFEPDCSYSFAVTDGKSNISVYELKKILAGE
ncbi:MAG: hypothetical protein J1E85_06250 [Ruminococcus sp.]|nr:hypothetical protein [Ruminococcus sp.]